MENQNSKKLSDNDLENVSGGSANCGDYHSEGACKAASCEWNSKDSRCYWIDPK